MNFSCLIAPFLGNFSNLWINFSTLLEMTAEALHKVAFYTRHRATLNLREKDL